MKVHPSARKHGIADADAVTAATDWRRAVTLSEDPQREFRLGFDTKARLLETVVLVFDSGQELLIHAMIARKSYEQLL